MAHEQRRHHVFGNRALMAEAVAQRTLRRQQSRVNRIRACPRRVVQPQRLGLRHGRVELDADDHVCRFIVLALTRQGQAVTQVNDVVPGPHQRGKTLAEVAGVLAVEGDFQSGLRHSESKVKSQNLKVQG